MNLFLPLAAFLAGSSGPAGGTGASVLDQHSLPIAGAPRVFDRTTVGPGLELGQSFVAGASGELSRLDLAITTDGVHPEATLEASLLDAAGRTLARRRIAFSALAQADSFGWDRLSSVQFGRVKVIAGETYQLILRPGAELGYHWVEDNDYLQGRAFLRAAGAREDVWLKRDIGFRTYVAAFAPAGGRPPSRLRSARPGR